MKKQSPNHKTNLFNRLVSWKKPTYKLEESHFLIENENFGTGIWRAMRMFYEYMRGFYAFRDIKQCISVFGSARFKPGHPFYELSVDVGQKLAKAGFMVMTGGGPGTMEGVSRGAKTAGGRVIACSLKVFSYEPRNEFVDTKIILRYFFVRKVMLTKYSCGFIFLPGGYGTLDELFEMLTLIQTKKIPTLPLILMGKTYWEPLLDFINDTLLENKTIAQSDINNLMVTDSPEEALDYINSKLIKIAKPS